MSLDEAETHLEDEEDDVVTQFMLNLPIPDDSTLSIGELEDRTTWIEQIRKGVGHVNAGLALGWTPYKINQLLNDPEYQAILEVCETSKDETVERALFRQAAAGNVQSMQMWLYARRPDKWVSTKKMSIESSEKVQIEVVHSVRDAAKALLMEMGPAALQMGGALDIVDAEVVGEE